MSFTLKTAVGIYYQEDQIDIEVVSKSLKDETFLGNLTLTGTSRTDPVLIRMEVQQFFAKLRVTPDEVLLAIGPDQVAFRHFSLPAEAEENLEQAVHLQLMNFVPSELEDFCIERIIQQDKDKDKNIEIDLYIIPREKVLRMVDYLKSIGLKVGCVTLTAFGFERLINRRGALPCKNTFVADLDFNHFSVYLFREGKFRYFKLAWINPTDKNLQQVLKEVERCASLSQVEGEAEIELFVNLSDPNWEEKIIPSEYPFIRRLTECSPFPNRAGNDLKGCAAGYLALGSEAPAMNLLPAELRPKPSRLGPALALILSCALLVGILLNVFLGDFVEIETKRALKAKAVELEKDFLAVRALKNKVAQEEKKLAAYGLIFKKPISDIVVLKDLSERINTNSYLFDYVRSDNLVIGGYADSALNLQSELQKIPYIRKISMEGAINRIRVPDQVKDGRQTFRELESFRMNVQFKDEIQ